MQAVDEYSIIEYTTAASSLYIPTDNPLSQEEGYRIVVGNGVYDAAWVGQELSKVCHRTICFSRRPHTCVSKQ